MMKMKSTAIFAILLCITGCGLLPSVKYKLSVRPVKYVPCWENMGPNTSCGSVTVAAEDAEGFIVIVGWKRFSEITNPNNISKVSYEDRLNKLANFASSEVVSRGYCKTAFVPRDSRRIMGWESSGDQGIYVVCMPQHKR